MMEFNSVNTIKCLTLIELPLDRTINPDEVRQQYRKLCQVYHPDVSNARYKDGRKFVELRDAQQFLIDNIDRVNALISCNFNQSTPQQPKGNKSSSNSSASESSSQRSTEQKKTSSKAEPDINRQYYWRIAVAIIGLIFIAYLIITNFAS